MKKRTPEQLAAAIERAKAVRSLQHHPGWHVIDQILADGIENARNRVMSDECDMDEVRALRMLVRWMERLRKTPHITDDDLEKWEQDLALRRKYVKIREALGVNARRPGPEDLP